MRSREDEGVCGELWLCVGKGKGMASCGAGVLPPTPRPSPIQVSGDCPQAAAVAGGVYPGEKTGRDAPVSQGL